MARASGQLGANYRIRWFLTQKSGHMSRMYAETSHSSVLGIMYIFGRKNKGT